MRGLGANEHPGRHYRGLAGIPVIDLGEGACYLFLLFLDQLHLGRVVACPC